MRGRGWSGKAMTFGVGTALGWAVARAATAAQRAPALEDAIDAPREVISTATTGELSMYADRRGEGRPLVLVHSINAAASAYEVRPIFERYRGLRPVFAIDLPGFGFSERRDHVHSPSLYTFAILTVLEQIARKDVACDVVALSLSAEFAARAARDRPDLVSSLTLISPTGLASHDERENLPRRAADLLASPVLGSAAYAALATRASIRHYLGKVFSGAVDPALAEYAYRTAHQPRARYAAAAFLRGDLVTPNVARLVYEKVFVPTLVLYDDDPYSDFARLPDVLLRAPSWRAVRVAPSRGLPHFEMPEETFAAMGAFWADVARRTYEPLRAAT